MRFDSRDLPTWVAVSSGGLGGKELKLTYWESARHRTAIARADLSMPAKQALADGVLRPGSDVMDFGSGRGLDVKRLADLGVNARGWDPHFDAQREPTDAEVVLLVYVLNVVEDVAERIAVLRRAWDLARSTLVVASRLAWDARRVSGEVMADGVLTSRGTFQHLYRPEELRSLVEGVTGVRGFAAAPGVVYAFRDDSARMSLIARRTVPQMQWSESRSVAAAVAQIVSFIESAGRPPSQDEVPEPVLADLAALPWARLVRQGRAAAKPEMVTSAAKRSTLDTLLFLGIEIFNGRGRLSSVPIHVQENIRRFFNSYREACARADRLLLKIRDDTYIRGAMRNSVGKLTPSALYVHRRAVSHLPVVLRLYEHCGAVAGGRPADYDIVKLAHEGRQVSWLGYPEFDSDPHPRTSWSYAVDMSTLKTRYTSFEGRENRPLLHRKEEFLHPDDPLAAKCRRLTQAEVKAGLYRNPQLIGTERGWEDELRRVGVQLRGHRLVKVAPRDD